MPGEIEIRVSPEQQELARMLAELSVLEGELADRELEHAALRQRLAAFEGAYLRRVGVLYAELDELNAARAAGRASETGEDDDRQEAARARQRAEESRAAVESEAANAPDFVASPELKRLYRDAAKKVHPDLSTDPEEKRRRERVMADANRAYESGDAEALKAILADFEASPESVTGEGIAADLVRAIRRIAQARGRIRAIESALAELRDSEMAALMEKADRYGEIGRDLLDELAGDLRGQIEVARGRTAAAGRGDR